MKKKSYVRHVYESIEDIWVFFKLYNIVNIEFRM